VPPITSPQIVDGIFSWQTACSHVATDIGCGNTSNIYTFAVKAYDDYCPANAITIATITVEVTAADSLPAPDFQCVWKDEYGNITFDWNHNIGASSSTIYHLYGAANIGGPYSLISDINYPLDSYSSLIDSLPVGAEYFYLTTESTCADNSLPSDTISPISFGITYTDVNCWDDTDGSIQVSVEDYINVFSYSYYLDGVLNTNAHPMDTFFNSVSAGPHIVSVTDAFGNCNIVVPVTISAPGVPLQALAADTMNSCFGGNAGIAIGSAAGGTPGYTYEWFDSGYTSFSTNDTAFGLSAGTYYLEVMDANGCDTFTSVNIISPQVPLSGSTQLFGVACKGENTGMIVGDAAGSWAPYQYHWFDINGDTLQSSAPNISTRDTLRDLYAGNYILHIYDSKGCFIDYQMFIDEPDFALSIDSLAIINPIDCYGDSIGKARLYVSGGDPVYTYLWDNGENTLIAQALISGYHTVSVIDDWGCEVIDSIYMPENPQIESSIIVDSTVSCYGLSDGIAWITTVGGASSSYTYFWSNGHIGNSMPDTATGLLHGSYYVTTRDVLGCEVVDSIYISQPEPITIEASELDWIDCFGDSTGLAYAIAQGGTLPYTFSWDNGQWFGDTVGTLTPGLHTVTVTDQRGCEAEDTVYTHEPPQLYINIIDSLTVYPYCGQLNLNTASLTAMAGGGTPGYTYVWDDNPVQPQTTTTATALTSYNYYSSDSSYTITVTDIKGCTASATTTALQSFTQTMDAQVVSLNNYNGYQVSCFGENDGSALVTAWGAHAPYNYQWYGPNGFTSNNDTIDLLYQGTYSVIIRDTNDCVLNRSIYLNEPNDIYFTTLGSTDESCLGACNGEVSIDIDGGVEALSYTAIATENTSGNTIVSLMSNDSIIGGVCSGDYTITITDANNCSSSMIAGGNDQETIGANTFTEANINTTTIVDILCNGSSTGALEVLNPNLNTGYAYSWYDINGVLVGTGLTATSLFAGDYVLHAEYMSYSGCTTTDTATVSQLDAITTSLVDITDVDCYGNSTGSISVNQISGGSGSNYVLQWSPGGQSTNSLNNLTAGIYTLTILDNNNCQEIDTFEVIQPAALTVNVNQNGYVLTANSPNGGIPPFSYSWREQSASNQELGVGPTYTVSDYGTYYVQVTDANGCVVMSNSFEYTEVPTGLENEMSLSLNIYPNPFSTETTIDFGRNVQDIHISIVDVYGKLVETHFVHNTDKYIIKKGTKASGIYFIEIDNDQTGLFKKLMVR